MAQKPKPKMKLSMRETEVASETTTAAKQDVPPNPNPEVSAPDPIMDLDTDGSLTARKMRLTPATLPTPRAKAGSSPKDYKEAASVIKSDKALYAQYKAGIASGKAFSLSVGGKSFKYAATPKETVSGLPGGNIRKSLMQEADEMSQVAVAKMRPGTATNTKTAPLELGEDDENAELRSQVRKMALRK